MNIPEKENSLMNQAWIVFPEIIGVSIIAIYAPIYLFQMFKSGQTAWAILGGFGWLVGIIVTALCFKHRLYYLALYPMLLLMGVGLLIDRILFP